PAEKSILFKEAQKSFDAEIKNYAKRHGISYETATEEILADKFVDYAAGRQGITGRLKVLFERLLNRIKAYLGNEDAINSIYADIWGGKFADNGNVDAQGLQQSEAYKENSEKIFEPTEEDKQTYDKSLRKALGNQNKGHNPIIELGKTPVVLQVLGFENLPVKTNKFILFKTVGEIFHQNAHDIRYETLQRLLDLFHNPLVVIKSSENSMVLVLNEQDTSGRQIVLAVRKAGNSYHFVPSFYGKDYITSYMRHNLKTKKVLYIKGKNSEISDELLQTLSLNGLQNSIPDGILTKADIISKYQRAWHGTGVKGITEFSNDKIGSGEGAQSFGWGHYASGRRGIGEWYRETVTRKNSRIDQKAKQLNLPSEYAVTISNGVKLFGVKKTLEEFNESMEFVKRAIEHIEDDKESTTDEKNDLLDFYISEEETLTKCITILKDIMQTNTGQLYELEIPESEDFLQWDGFFHEQSEKVKKALLKLQTDLTVRDMLNNEGEKAVYDALVEFGTVEFGNYYEHSIKYLGLSNFFNLEQGYNFMQHFKNIPAKDDFERFRIVMGMYEKIVEIERIKAKWRGIGRDMYHRLSNMLGSDKAASLKLLEYGILGNEYPAGSYSGNTDSEARNFVLFDPKYIEIKKTYYQSGIDERLQSENFKKWFGDWEAARELTINRDGINKDEAITKINKLNGKDIKNIKTGITAQVNTEQRDKLVSNAAVDKSIANGFTREQHYAVAGIIDTLFENALLTEERKGRKGEKDIDIKSIKRFVASFQMADNNEINYAYITLKESVEHGHKIYSVELQEIKRLGSMLETSISNKFETNVPPSRANRIIKELNKKFNVSKVVDGQGRPLIVYHGSRTGGGFSKFGKFSFFIDNKDVADIFGKEAGYTLIVNGKKRIVDSQAMDIIRGIEMYEDEDWFLGVNFAEWLNDDGAYSERVADKIEELREYDFIKDPGEIKELRIEKNDNLYAVYLDIKNPLVLDAKGAEWYPADKDEPGKYFVPERHIKEAIEGGYDGLIVKNIIEGGLGSDNSAPATDYIVFNPKQIKSVDNEGGFSRKSADIYKQGNRAMLELTSEGKPLVTLFEDADASSVIHEFGHIWLNEGLRFLEEYEAAGGSEAYLKEQGIERQYINDLIFLRKHLGIEAGAEITRQQHEVFARSFEAYLFEGKAPTMELRRVFENFRRWLLKIYRTVLSLEAPLNDEIRGVFDRMLATEEEIEIAESMKDYAKFGEEVLDEPDKKRLETITETAKMKAFEIMLKEQMSKYGVKEISKMKKMRQEAIKKGIDNFAKEAIYSAQKSIEETFKSPAKEIAQKYRDRMTELDEAKGNDIKRWYQSDSGLAERIKKLESRDSKKYQPHNKLSKKEAEGVFRQAGEVSQEKIGKTRFPIESAGKILRQQGFDTSTIIKYLPELYENSILLNSIPEKEYQQRKDSRQHKKHPNISLWHNTLNKFKIGNDEFYIRFTVTETELGRQKKGGEKLLHSAFVSDIKLYKAGK
ncbi:MAG: hypothetical protein LBH29_04735, partial [Elusimicrobiota bacterium]|nr:hypothetical protein [Elusimicrobiota bacterium]